MLRRKHTRFAHGSHSLTNTPETLYARKQAATWLLRVMEHGVLCNSYLFECAEWCIGDLRPLFRNLAATIKKMPKKASVIAALEAVEFVLKNTLHRLASELETIAEDHSCVRGALGDLLFQECSLVCKKNVGDTKIFSAARKQLRATFGISDNACALCEYIFIKQSFSPIDSYFESHLEVHKYGNRRFLAYMLGMQSSELQRHLRELESCGLIETGSYSLSLKDGVASLWESTIPTNGEKRFCSPLSGKVIPLENFTVAREDVDHLTALMSQPGDSPVHVFLYGPPGTGKTTFVRSLAKKLGVKAWTVISRERDDEDDRRASLTACLHMASKHKGAFVLVDEAERLLDTGMHLGWQTKDKAWLNAFLEQPGRRVIWISNHVDHIDQAVRRRFTYSIHFKELGPQERVKIWRQILERNRVLNRLSSGQLEDLAKNHDVSAAVIEQAVNQAKGIYRGRQQFHSGLERILQSYNTLRRNGVKQRRKPRAVDDYTLDGVCIDGSAQELMDRCRRVDTAIKEAAKVRPGSATMLFYGPPGTGKTALARYIAKELKRECIVKRASDLLSPWVGMSEQLVAEAFREAEDQNTVLVIDEADSFLYSRDTAQRSWETSLVNEFLTGLEECRGFCICTTNRRENLDAAAMRRFSHKVAFTFAKEEQVLALYDRLLAPLCTEPLPVEAKKELLTLNRLTPGDFHVTRSQFESMFVDLKKISHKDLIASLIKEQSLKTERKTRRIGFGGSES